jgi:hypothetical protein
MAIAIFHGEIQPIENRTAGGSHAPAILEPCAIPASTRRHRRHGQSRLPQGRCHLPDHPPTDARIRYLPPCSPDLKAIEQARSTIKHRVRQAICAIIDSNDTSAISSPQCIQPNAASIAQKSRIASVKLNRSTDDRLLGVQLSAGKPPQKTAPRGAV